MNYYNMSIVLLLILFTSRPLSATPTTLVYHHDMSQYCRRQVVPSVFVSRQITEANSHIIHFLKLDLPYTCSIDVRTESGNNLILVSETISNKDLTEACSKNPNQLLVYVMGETFGGYWGPLPDELIRREYPATTKYYTLKTTTNTLKRTDDENEETEPAEINYTSILKMTETTTSDENFVTVEVPLVNVSVSFLPGESLEKDNIDAEDVFELLYDVTPWPSSKYDTSILPLVQFSINQHKPSNFHNFGRKGTLDSDLTTLTPDLRLTYPRFTYISSKRRPWKKQKYDAIRRINFKKNRNLFSPKTTTNPTFYKYRVPFTGFQPLFPSSTRFPFHTSPGRVNILKTLNSKQDTIGYISLINTSKEDNISSPTEVWNVIEDLLKIVNKNEHRSTNVSSLLHKISVMKHNFSAYLAPNLSIYDNVPPGGLTPIPRTLIFSTKNTMKPFSLYKTLNGSSTDKLSNATARIELNTGFSYINETLTTSGNITSLKHDTLKERRRETSTIRVFTSNSNTNYRKSINFQTRSITKQYSINNTSTDLKVASKNNTSFKLEFYFPSTPKLSGSLVGHESWENIVQSAPEMAVLLNETRDDGADHVNETNSKLEKRNKRTIDVIPIEDDRSWDITTRTTSATSEMKYGIRDMQEFAQFVELQDDEVHGHVALSDVKQFSGPILYNICDSQKAGSRGVSLFNASRIILSIGNFSMQGLTLILTPASTLLTGNSGCSSSDIECQVSGARVCIDALATCDGIPNCGSDDIYDEDRLLCGISNKMQQNVFLAAFTLLAFMFTMLYIVHYWLKKYVPKVSEAFFIYINGFENILYLDTIMRHPNENADDDTSKLMYPGNVFEDDIFYLPDIKRGKMTIMTFLKKIFTSDCLRKKRITQDDIFFPTFPETELRPVQKELVDTTVQTGDSLELTNLGPPKNKDYLNIDNKLTLPFGISGSTAARHNESVSTELMKDHSDELSMLKFFRKSRSDSIRSLSFDTDTLIQSKAISGKTSVTMSEKEIEILEYISPPSITAGPSERHGKLDDHNHSTSEWRGKTKKHLRFDEEATIIPSMEFREVEAEGGDEDSYRRGVDLTKPRGPESTKIENYNNGGRRFWGKGKGKKQNKRANY